MNRFLIGVLVAFSFVASAFAKERKVIYIIVDGIPADYIERTHPQHIFDIAKEGAYARAYTGGEIGAYSQTATISAIGYTNILTGTWMNKHNVNGNENLSPRYQYWSLFRIAKEQKENYTTGLFSSWTDNRKVLVGEGKAETNQLKIDYVVDGYDLDNQNFPKKKDDLQIWEIDSVVAEKAAVCIKENAPDVNWVYFWYTDDAFHIYGDGEIGDKYVYKTDELVGKIWESVKYREANFDEEWLFIVTTDHGRDETGHHHGGQTQRERGVWIATNYKKTNKHFKSPYLSLVDINPTICNYMGFELPQEVLFEQDGVSFIGKADVVNLTTQHYDDQIILNWESYDAAGNLDVYVAFSNDYLTGGKDEWVKVASVPAKEKKYVFNRSKYPSSKFYKFTVCSPDNHLTRWCNK